MKTRARPPEPHELEPIERASIDEIRGVQLERLRGTLEAPPSASEGGRGECGERLAKKVKDRIGVSAEVEVRAAGGVERSLGKARRVYDQRAR